MKKVFLSAAVFAFIFISCDGDKATDEEKKKGPSVCDCMKMGEEAMEEMKEAGDDMDKLKELEEKYKEKAEECKKLGEGKSEEEMKALEEEAKNCK
jgi:CRISPR-associated protein Cas8b1/Cst1 subtype I-B